MSTTMNYELLKIIEFEGMGDDELLIVDGGGPIADASLATASCVSIAVGYSAVVAGVAICVTGIGAPAGLSLIGGGLAGISGGLSGLAYTTGR